MAESERAPTEVLTVSLPEGQQSTATDDEAVSPSVLDALGDSACRTILREVNEPMSAQDIAAVTDLPLSTTYRKLDFLSQTVLLKERTEVRPDGNHSTLYVPDFEAVRIVVDKRKNIDVSISRAAPAQED